MDSEDTLYSAGGVMGELIRTKDWSQTPVGAVSEWPESLRAAVSICLGTVFPVSIYWGEQFCLIYNDAWSAFPAHKHPSILGEPVKVAWPALWLHTGPVLEEVFNKGANVSASGQLILIERDGFTEETYFDHSFSAIRGSSGEVLGVFYAGLEITSHVLSERRSRLFQTLFNNIYVGASEVQILEKAAGVLKGFPEDIPYFALYSYNGEVCKPVVMEGLEQEPDLTDVIGKVLSTRQGLLIDTQSDKVLKRTDMPWAAPCCRAYLVPIVLHDGEIGGFMEAGISPHRQFDDQYRAFLEAIAVHLSSALTNARAQREKEISTRQLRDLFMVAPVSIVVFRGPDFIVEAANDRVLEIWGKPDENIEGKMLLDVLPELQDAPIYNLLQRVYELGERIVSQELRVRLLRDGKMEDLYLNFVLEPLHHEETGGVARIIVVAHDVTDLVMARQLAQSNTEKLSELMKQKDEFLSITSHELKSPITSVKAYMQLAQRVIDPKEKAHGFVTKANTQLERLEKLITDLLDVSRINAGRMTFNFELFDFRQLLQECVENVQQSTTRHQIVIERADEARIEGDRMRIEQVLNNFLGNAVKYSPDADRVLVRAEVKNDEVVVCVRDFGIGIEKAHLDKLFDRFYRVENTAARYQGLGLGLFISSEIIRKHKGSFWIESEPGMGSSFYFKLPLSKTAILEGPGSMQSSFYQDKFISLAYDEKNRRINADWKSKQTDESIKECCRLMLRMMEQHNCTKVLNCNENVEGNWSAAIKWLGEEWFPAMEEAGLKCFAWILSPGSFNQLASLKSINIFKGNPAVKFFLNRKEAIAWLGDTD